MKNQPGDRKIFNIFRLCFLMLLAASAIGAAVYTVTNPQIETWGSDVIYLDGLQAQDRNGNPIEITANQRYEYDENDILEVSGTLPDRVRDGDYICFLTWYDTEILVNGEEINRFSASAVTLPGGLLKSVYFFTPLQAEYAGQPVTIRYHRGEDSATCRVFEMTVGTRADLYRMIVEKYGYQGKYPPDIAAAKTIADISAAIHSRSYAAMTPEEKKNLIISLITDAIS